MKILIVIRDEKDLFIIKTMDKAIQEQRNLIWSMAYLLKSSFGYQFRDLRFHWLGFKIEVLKVFLSKDCVIEDGGDRN